jgi:hypothetical protein
MKREDPPASTGGPEFKANIDGTGHPSICPFPALKASRARPVYRDFSRPALNDFARIITRSEFEARPRYGLWGRRWR